MGYRSDVVLACAFPTPEKLLQYIAKQRMLPKVGSIDVWKDHLKDDMKIHTALNKAVEGYTVAMFEAHSWKWDEYYEDVKAIQKFFKSASDHGGAWIEVQVGEDNATSTESDCNSTYYEGEDEEVPQLVLEYLQDNFYTTCEIHTPKEETKPKNVNDFIKEAKL